MYFIVVTIMRALGHLLNVLVVVGRLLVLMVLVVPISWLFVPFVMWNMRRWERDRIVEVLGCIEQAILLNLPVAVLIDASSAMWSPKSRREAKTLVERLRSGDPVGDAMLATMSEIPTRWRSLLEVGNQRGQLLQAIHRILEEHRRFVALDTGRSGVVLYFLMMASVFVMIFAGIATFVMPMMESLVEDFAVEPTWALRLFFESQSVVSSPIFWLVLMGAAVLATVGIVIESMTISKQLTRGLMTAGWYVPGIAGLVQARANSDVCGNLADATAAGVPLPQALRNSQELILPMQMSRRLRRWAHAVEAGLAPAEAAAAGRMHPMMATLVRFTGSHAHLAQGFDFLAGHFAWVTRRRTAILQKAMMSVLFLFMAAAALLTALAIITYLTAMQWIVIVNSGVF